MNNPLLKYPNFIFYLIIWIVFILAGFLLLTHVLNLDAHYALIDSVLSWFIFLWLGLGIWYPAKFMSFDDNSMLKIIARHLSASFVTSAIWVGITYVFLMLIVDQTSDYRNYINSSLGWRLLTGIFFYIIIVSLYYIYIYYSNFQNKLLKESELRTLIKEAELKTLRYQINPHFIFNSLNSISSLTMINPDKAREMTIKLSSYLRATLATNERQMHRLSEEIANCRLYLDIERIRFENKFDYQEDVQAECSTIDVPNMILQPLFENAIKHGVYESLEKITIRFLCRLNGQYLKITVENDYDAETPSKKGERIGLRNIKERLKLIYNQDNLLAVENKPGLFKVNIYIPLETA